MFHHRRRHPLADILDWTDYHVGGGPPPLHGFTRRHQPGFWGHGSRRRSPLARLLIGLAIVMAVVYVVQRLTSRNRSNWF